MTTCDVTQIWIRDLQKSELGKNKERGKKQLLRIHK